MSSAAPGIWQRSLVADEAAIVSDKYDHALFLIRLHHDGEAYPEEQQKDTYGAIQSREIGERWL